MKPSSFFRPILFSYYFFFFFFLLFLLLLLFFILSGWLDLQTLNKLHTNHTEKSSELSPKYQSNIPSRVITMYYLPESTRNQINKIVSHHLRIKTYIFWFEFCIITLNYLLVRDIYWHVLEWFWNIQERLWQRLTEKLKSVYG